MAFVIVMSIFIRCCAIHTPSSNPNLPKNLNFGETLRRPVRSLQQKVSTRGHFLYGANGVSSSSIWQLSSLSTYPFFS